MNKIVERVKSTKATTAKVGAMIGAVVATTVIVAAVLLTRDESYRTVAVEEVNGTTLVSSNGKEVVNAFEGMHLYSGDDVSVQQESDMTLVLDMDKYAYAEEGTHFWLECKGTADDSRTVIYMDTGSVLNHIKDNLNEGEVYQVDTPNSTMAVRGTVFRVTVYRGEDGLVYTLVEVFEGNVQVDLKTEDGEYNGVSEIFGSGESALIRGNSDFSEFVLEEDGSEKREIAYKEIPQKTAKILVGIIDEGKELCIGKELLMDYTQLAEHRMETRKGKESTCTEPGYKEVWCVVCNEVTENIELPLLEHEVGDWEITLEPTCEKNGSRQKVCSVCGAVCESEELKELGHQMGALQTITNATCIGIGEQVSYCEVCHKEMQRVVISALGHIAGDTVTVKHPNCTVNGVTQTKCSRCGIVLSEGSITKTGHNWGNWEVISVGSCTSSGVERRTCSSCGSSEEKSSGTGSHNMEWEVDIEATCVAEGHEIGTCVICSKTEERTIGRKEHKYVHGHDIDSYSVSPDTGTATITCLMRCSECGEVSETLHELCEVMDDLCSEGYSIRE